MEFTKKDQISLNEIERRLRYFLNGDLDTYLLLLALPSEVNTLISKGYIKPSNIEIKRQLNWYNLTNKGKELFSKIVLSKIDNKLNRQMFEGKIIRNYNNI